MLSGCDIRPTCISWMNSGPAVGVHRVSDLPPPLNVLRRMDAGGMNEGTFEPTR